VNGHRNGTDTRWKLVAMLMGATREESDWSFLMGVTLDGAWWSSQWERHYMTVNGRLCA
jgi:hypothetical protein